MRYLYPNFSAENLEHERRLIAGFDQSDTPGSAREFFDETVENDQLDTDELKEKITQMALNDNPEAVFAALQEEIDSKVAQTEEGITSARESQRRANEGIAAVEEALQEVKRDFATGNVTVETDNLHTARHERLALNIDSIKQDAELLSVSKQTGKVPAAPNAIAIMRNHNVLSIAGLDAPEDGENPEEYIRGLTVQFDDSSRSLENARFLNFSGGDGADIPNNLLVELPERSGADAAGINLASAPARPNTLVYAISPDGTGQATTMEELHSQKYGGEVNSQLSNDTPSLRGPHVIYQPGQGVVAMMTGASERVQGGGNQANTVIDWRELQNEDVRNGVDSGVDSIV